MSGDQRCDRQKSEMGSQSSLPRREATTPGGRGHVHESEPPTQPRGRTLADSDAPLEPPVGSIGSAYLTAQDSFLPVRVPVRTGRPPLSLWTRAWATVGLVIVVGAGAGGIVASLRARTLVPGGRDAPSARSRAAVAAQNAPQRGIEAKQSTRATPAAAPGLTAPPPALPSLMAYRNGASSVGSLDVPPIASSPGAVSARASPTAVAFRTPESLAISPPVAPSGGGTALALARRPKPTETASPPIIVPPPPKESAHSPTPAPATSDSSETKGESEAWVTEERRF